MNLPRTLDVAMTLAAVLVAALVFAPISSGQENTAPRPHSPYLAGQLLVASPTMKDPRFAETVIFMVNHDADGALGLVVNKAYGEGSMTAFLDGIGMNVDGASGNIRIHYGGPVQPGAGFVLHSTDYHSPDTIVRGEVAFTTDLDILKDMATNKGPSKSLFVLGYAGWGPRQLEGELARDDWTTAPADADLIFDPALDSKWEKARAKSGKAL